MWMPVIVMIEENQHPILYWHGETAKTFFPDLCSLKGLLWLFLSEQYCILFVLPIFIEFVSCLHVIPLFFGCQSAMSCWHYLLEKGKCKLWFTFVVFFTSPVPEDYWGLGHMGLLEHFALAAVLKPGVEAGGTKLKTWPLSVRNSKP